jgi:hypothetical protein
MPVLRFVLRLPALLAMLGACGAPSPADRPPDEGTADSAAAPVEVPLLPSFRTLEFAAPVYRTDRERGVGIAFPRGYMGERAPQPETLTVHTRPDATAAAVARLIRSDMGVYALEVRTDVGESGALEHGYEDIGLPLLEEPSGPAPEWLHVHYALAPDGTPLDGWLRNDTSSVATLLWRDQLPESPLFFLEPDSIGFHGSPEGPPVRLELTRSDGGERFDYIMYALETRAAWMRVEVVTPSNYCFDPPAPRRDTLWIRYLDPRGRPRVWYYTRGC